MIRVCHMTSSHGSNDARIFKKECTSLAKAGYKVFLVAPGKSRVENGVFICGVPKRLGRLERMLFVTHDIYKQAKALNADIYHFHDPELLPYGIKLAKKGKKVIFDSHENYVAQIKTKDYLPRITRNLIARIYQCYETHACAYYSAVITPCRFNGESIFEGRAHRTAFVGNKALNYEQSSLPMKSNTKATICCLGSLTHARGITHLVKASHLAEVKLILCGPITEKYLKELQTMPEYENVEYRGVLEPEELVGVMSECFAGAAVGLNRGQYLYVDTLPTKVADYLLNGLPVLLYKSPFNQQFIEESKCGVIVDTDNIESFAKSIKELQLRAKNDECLPERCRLYAIKHLLWDSDEKELLALYDEIVRKS